MQISEFKSVVRTFADPGSDFLFEKNKMLISVNGDLIDVGIATREGDVFINDGEESSAVPASTWIIKRLAKLPLLATRLRDGVGQTQMFVSPSATLLPSLEVDPNGTIRPTDDALNTTLEALKDRSALESTILYITSDAGEGKTFLINQMAKIQAKSFIDGGSDWLLVPIPLGGKHFLRFDDVTVGALQNRYRFPFLYYDSFLALVRMGVLVPAFDGFEEMFVESSSGEALSAMGILVSLLDSQGALVIAARKAYFEFENLKTQEKLFDSISTYSVGFAKLELRRWGQKQFLEYCKERRVENADRIYDRVSERLGPNHSLLTRPVLVRRLVDIATESLSLDSFIDKIHASGPDFFSVFVRGIVEREANEKWIDRSGEREVGTPLLSVEQHCQLLSNVAVAMWDARVDYLKRDQLEFVTDYYSECTKVSSFQAQQIRERIRGHALLISSPNAAQAVEFDHEEFRLFFLGEGIAHLLLRLDGQSKGEVLAALRKGILPKPAQHAFLRALRRDSSIDLLEAAHFLFAISLIDGQASYTQENATWLMLQILSEIDAKGLELHGLAFPSDILRDRKLTNLRFRECYFSPTSMDLSVLNGCKFENCKFGQLRIFDSTAFQDVVFEKCTIDALVLTDRDQEFWEPSSIQIQLERLGISFPNEKVSAAAIPKADVQDLELRDFEKLIRHFTRATHINDRMILLKLGTRAQHFMDYELPKLLNVGLIAEIEHRGGGSQRRFKISKSLESINSAVAASHGSYQEFLDKVLNSAD